MTESLDAAIVVAILLGSSAAGAAVQRLLSGRHRSIRALQPQDAKHSRLAADCLNQFEHLTQTRWKLIEDAGSSISTPFYFVLVFWLVIVFAGFGLYAPRHLLSYVTIGLGALSIASAIYVILDMDTPFSAVFTVSSAPLRDALQHRSR